MTPRPDETGPREPKEFPRRSYWAAIEHGAMRDPALYRCVTLVRSGAASKVEALSETLLWALKELSGMKDREVERLKREPGP